MSFYFISYHLISFHAMSSELWSDMTPRMGSLSLIQLNSRVNVNATRNAKIFNLIKSVSSMPRAILTCVVAEIRPAHPLLAVQIYPVFNQYAKSYGLPKIKSPTELRQNLDTLVDYGQGIVTYMKNGPEQVS